MCFHHINPEEKDKGIAQMMNQSYKNLQTELDKCVLLCNNCHMEVHEGMHPDVM